MPGLTIDETARFLGHATWVEQRLFEVVGSWVPETPDPVVKLALARASRHHGAHAEVLEALRPDTRDHDLESRSPFDPGWRTLVNQMVAATAPAQRLDRLVGVLGETIACYEEHLGALVPVRDVPLRRALLAVLDDERADLSAFERLRSVTGG
jgi:hypothetical protein